MTKEVLEKAALVVSIAIIGAGVWFWILQLGDVIALLEMAG